MAEGEVFLEFLQAPPSVFLPCFGDVFLGDFGNSFSFGEQSYCLFFGPGAFSIRDVDIRSAPLKDFF